MADGHWQKLSFDFGPITPLAEAVQTLADTINIALSIIKTATDIIATLLTDFISAEAMLIKAALTAIDDVLKQLIQGTAKLHMLVVPPRKALPFIDTLDTTDWTAYNNPFTQVGPTPTMEDSRNFYEKLDSVFKVLGGNPAYGRTVLESLVDPNDQNRPQYGPTDAYFSVVILAGTTSILELIGIIMALTNVFKGSLRNPMLPTEIARPPQDVRARIIAAPNTPRIGVRLSWKNPPTRQELRAFDAAQPLITQIREVAIVRSTDPSMVQAKTWDTLMAGFQPTQLGSSDTEKTDVKTIKTPKGTTVLKYLGKFDWAGSPESYVDSDPVLAKGTYNKYYYAVAFRYSMAMPDLNGKVTESSHLYQRYSAISNVVTAQADKDRIPSCRTGNFPDWDATPNVLDLIPDLKFFLALIQNYVETMKSQLVGASSALLSYIAFLKSEIARYSAYAAAISDRVRALAELMRFPQSGVYVTLIANSKGGTQDFIGQLTSRLTDETDATAPPYFRYGVTAGVVLFAGAPNPADLASVQELIALLLGLNSGQSALGQAIESIDNVVGLLEKAPVFAPDMTVDTSGTTTTTIASQQTFNDALEPVDPGSTDANVPFDP